MLPDMNKGRGDKALLEILAVIEPQLKAVRDLTQEVAQMRALSEFNKDNINKLCKFVIEGNGRPSLSERVTNIEEQLEDIVKSLEKAERIPDRVTEIKEEVSTLIKTHEGHSNRNKWLVGVIGSAVVALIPLLWQTTPKAIKLVEMLRYNMVLYDRYLQKNRPPIEQLDKETNEPTNRNRPKN